MNLEFLRVGLKLLLGELLKKLPVELQESFISQAVLAMASAESAEQVQLEITAIIGEIELALEKGIGEIHV